MPSQRNPFGIGKQATNRVNIVKLENAMATYFRRGINRPVPVLTPNDPIPTNITGSAIPVPDGALTTKYFKDKSITSELIAKNIALPPNALFTGNGVDGSNNMPATIGFVKPLAELISQQIFDMNEITETLELFSNDFSTIAADLTTRDPPLSAIEEDEWVVASKIGDQAVVGSHFSEDISLPSGISMASTQSNTGAWPATTSYMRSQYSQFTQDASISSVGNLARAVLNMTDASFRIFAEEKKNKAEYENTYRGLDISAVAVSNSTQSVFSLDQTTKYSVLESGFDNSLNGLYSHQGPSSLLAEIMNNIEETGVTIGRDASLSLLYGVVDACFNAAINTTFHLENFEENLVLPINATGIVPTDTSSNQVATTSYVKSQLQEKIAATEVIASYHAFATAVGGDASFAYKVVQEIAQLDSSMAVLETRVDTIPTTTFLPSLYETVERNLATQDISMAGIPLMPFQNTVDVSLSSLDIIIEDKKNEVNTETVAIDTSLVILDAVLQDMSVRLSVAGGDASYTFLDAKLTAQNENLVATDASLLLFLANRENMVESGFSIANSGLLIRKTGQDASLVLLKQTVDNSASLMSSFLQSDSSLASLDTQVDNLTLDLQLYGGVVDSSLEFVERNIPTDTSLVYLAENFDAMFPVYESNNTNLDRKIETIDVSLNHVIDVRNAAIENGFSDNYHMGDISLNEIVFILNSRETQYSEVLGKIDASFQYGEETYSLLYDYASVETIRLRDIDASLTEVGAGQHGKLTSTDSSLASFSQYCDLNLSELDSSVNHVEQVLGQLDYPSFDSSIGEIERKTATADSSLVAIAADEWVSSERLAANIQFDGATIADLATDTSGQEVANTAFFKERLREVVGSAMSPLDGLNELAAAVNNLEDYTIYLSGYLGDIGLALNSINTAMGDLSMNTGETFNYDASLALLDEKFYAREGSANWIETRVDTWTSTVDGSMGFLFERNQAMDISMGDLGNRELQIESLVSREIAATELYSIIKSGDASLGLLAASLENATISIEEIAANIPPTESAIANITGRFDTSLVSLDASYGVALAKWENIETEPRFNGLDTSLSSISAAISSVEGGVADYLGTALEASSYRTALNYIDDKLDKIDTSMAAIATGVDASYSTFIGVIETRGTGINNLGPKLQQIDASYGAVFNESTGNAGSIETIDSSGWVVSERLDEGVVLPDGVRISTGNTDIGTAADVREAIQGLIAGVGPALDTLGEFAAALNNDASLSSLLNSRIQATDASYNFIVSDLPPRITTQTEEYAGRVSAIEGLSYSVLNNGTSSLFSNMWVNDVSTNLAGEVIVGANGKTESVFGRLAANDVSTNLVDGQFSSVENTIGVLDISLGGEEGTAASVETTLTGVHGQATQVATGLATNDISTNLLGSGLAVSEASANTVMALLGTPTNFGVSETTTTALTCSYAEPVLRDAVDVNNYRLTATPIYGSVSTIVRDVSAGVNQVQLTGLTSGAVYDLSLAATNPYGTVVVSGVSGGTVLVPPSGLVGSASTASSFTASWTSGGGALSSYEFNLKNGATDISSGEVSSVTTSRNFTGLLDGTPYLVAVRARNPYVVSTDVSMIYGTVFNAPSSLAFASRTTNSMRFSVAGTTKPYTQYNISYRLFGGAVASATDTSSNMNLTGLSSGRIYDVSVNIQNAYGTSVWSNTVRNSTAIALPATLTVSSITPVQATVSYTALATQDCSYVLRTVPNTTQYILTTGSTTQTLTGLTALTSYTVFLDASNTYISPAVNISATFSTPGIINQNIYRVSKAAGVDNTSTTVTETDSTIGVYSNIVLYMLCSPTMDRIVINKLDETIFRISSDKGKTFVNASYTSDGNVKFLIGSESTQYIYTRGNNNNIWQYYRSTNYGSSFTVSDLKEGSNFLYIATTGFRPMHCSRDGSKVVFYRDNPGYIYMSNNYGVNFTLIRTLGFSTGGFACITISNNSKYIVLTMNKRIYVGYNENGINIDATNISQTTWTDKTFSTALNNFTRDIDITDNGMIFAPALTASNVINYITYANFINATALSAWSSTTVPTSPSTTSWGYSEKGGNSQIRVSSDGNTIIVIQPETSTLIYTSVNRGSNWNVFNLTSLGSARNLRNMYVNPNFDMVLYGTNDLYLYYSKSY